MSSPPPTTPPQSPSHSSTTAPTTPPRTDAPSEAATGAPTGAPTDVPKVTPLRRSTASRGNSEHPTGTQAEIKPYLKVDIETPQNLSFEEFLTIAFEVDINSKSNRFDAIVKTPEFANLFSNYTNARTEKELYDPFIELAEYIFGKLSETLAGVDSERVLVDIRRNDHKKVSGGCGPLMPDCVAVPRGAPLHIIWSLILAFLEFKKKKAKGLTDDNGRPSTSSVDATSSAISSVASSSAAMTSFASTSSKKRKTDSLTVPSSSRKRVKTESAPNEDKLQCASYALEMLSHGHLRSHVFGALITDCDLQLLYYDRSLPVYSNVVNFQEKPEFLVAFLCGLQNLTMSRWGYFSAMAPGKLTLGNGAVLKLNDKAIFRQHGIIGRGTYVTLAEVESQPAAPFPNEKIVVKFSYAASGRAREGEILEKITDITKEKNEKMLLHLPEILYREDFQLTEIQDRVLKRFPDEYEKRELRVLVMTELFPITKLTTTELLAPVIKDIFQCYKFVHEEANYIHRDISLNNLMYREKEEKIADESVVTYHGVLTDFDLSVTVSGSGDPSTSKQRTGTLPYMAIDLLENSTSPPRHLYRHDLESFFYVIVVLTTLYDGGKRIKIKGEHAVDEWFENSGEKLARSKKAFINSPVPDPLPKFIKMKDYIQEMADMFQEGVDAKRRYVVAKSKSQAKKIPIYNEETYGGHVDFDKFAHILNSIAL